jgi:hypothetical protein
VSYTSTIEVQTAKLKLKAETEVFIKRPDFLLLRVRTDHRECEIVRQGQQVHVRHAREETFAAGLDWPATRARILEHVPATLRPAVIAALVTIDTGTKNATFDQNFYGNYAGVAFRALFEMGGLGPETEAKDYNLAIHGLDSILAAGSGVTPEGDGLLIQEFQISWDAAVKGAQTPPATDRPGSGGPATARQPVASWQETLHNVRVSRELVPFLAVLEASYAAPKDLAKELKTLQVSGIAWDKTPVADAIADLGDKIAAAHPDGARIPILLLTEFAQAKRNLPPVTATFKQATVAEVLAVAGGAGDVELGRDDVGPGTEHAGCCSSGSCRTVALWPRRPVITRRERRSSSSVAS